jgi:hypothetical protein
MAAFVQVQFVQLREWTSAQHCPEPRRRLNDNANSVPIAYAGVGGCMGLYSYAMWCPSHLGSTYAPDEVN